MHWKQNPSIMGIWLEKEMHKTWLSETWRRQLLRAASGKIFLPGTNFKLDLSDELRRNSCKSMCSKPSNAFSTKCNKYHKCRIRVTLHPRWRVLLPWMPAYFIEVLKRQLYELRSSRSIPHAAHIDCSALQPRRCTIWLLERWNLLANVLIRDAPHEI